jgi:glucose dehydrogenase
MVNKSFLIILAGVWIVYPHGAEAYIGPGVGAGALAAVVGVLGSIFLGLFAIVYYPFKRMLKRRKKTATVAKSDAVDDASRPADQ